MAAPTALEPPRPSGELFRKVHDLLRPFSAGGRREDFLRALADQLRAWSGCEAVGIRLRDGDDYPYFETRGFPDDFVALERSLCDRDADGRPRLGPDGRPVLECMCGNVLQGRVDPRQPFFSGRGSFWSNGTSALLAGTTEKERQSPTRNRCNGYGYESVALVPLRSGGETFGLLQFNDATPGRFSPELLEFLESLGECVALALSRQEVLARLAESEARYRGLFEADNAVKLVVDPENGRIVDANAAAVRFYGYGREELLGLEITRINTAEPGAVRRAMAEVRDGIRAGRPFEFRHRLKSGELRMVEVHSGQLPSGGRTLLFSIIHDVTRRKAMERERLRHAETLAEQHALLESLVHNATLLIGVVEGPEHRYVLANPVYRAVPADPAPMLGRSVAEVFPEVAAEVVPLLDEVRATGEHRSLREYPVPVGSRLTWWDADYIPLQNAAGEVRRILILGREVTERRKAAEDMRRAKDAAEAANRAKTHFLASMSHEIRTPLNGVLGMLQLIGSGAAGEELPQLVNMATVAGKRLLALLNDILDYSRAEAGHVELCAEPFAVGELFEAVERQLRAASAKKGLTLSFLLHPGVAGRLLGDPGRILQILFNLVSNAVKFTNAGEVRLEAWTRPARNAPGRTRLYFSIGDTGMGIPDEMIEHVFRRFTQVDSSYTRRFEGAGLGLAIVKRLVDLMDGQISVDSETGRGTTVYVSLLLDRAPAEAPAEPAERPARPDQPAAHGPDGPSARAGSGLRLLLVEDDAISRMATGAMLRRMGHEVVEAANGSQAVEAARAGGFNAVLMDIQMPVMDGVEATRSIRALSDPPDAAKVHIVAVTAYAMQGDQEKFLAAGMNDYIKKPLLAEDLAAALERLPDEARRAH